LMDEGKASEGMQGRAWDDAVSIPRILSALLQQRRLIIGVTIACTLVALVVAIRVPTRFTSSASFLPEGASSGRGLQGLVGLVGGQLGIPVPFQCSAASPEFYLALLKSTEILGVLASEEFSVAVGEGEERTGTITDLLELGKGITDPGLRHEAGVRGLRSRLKVEAGRQTGLVSLSVTTPWSDLSQTLVARLLALLTEFNLERRQSQAAAERAFIGERIGEARDSLRAAEGRLATFLQNNRQWEGSPDLSFRRDRLQRDVIMRQQLYSSLAESFEQARISEVRDTPTFTVVEQPRAPVKRDPRRRSLILMIGLAVGVFTGTVAASVRIYARWAKSQGDPDYDEFLGVLSEAWGELWGGFRRR